MNERLLLVEDDRTNLKLLTYILKPYGYHLLTARNGVEALKIIAKHEPDLILLDVRLPDINGFEICHQLKSNKRTEHIPIIFVSALAQEVYRLQGLELGAADYITKPFDRDDLIRRVSRQLELYRNEEKTYNTLEDRNLQPGLR